MALTLSAAVIKDDPPATNAAAPNGTTNSTAPTESYYELLGLRQDANVRQVKAAYRRMAVKAHPDKYNDPVEKAVANERFMRIAQAYDVLSNDIKRKLYDSMVAKGMMDFDEDAYLDMVRQNGMDGESGWGKNTTPYTATYMANSLLQ